MFDELRSFRNFTLATSPSGQSITVGEAVEAGAQNIINDFIEIDNTHFWSDVGGEKFPRDIRSDVHIDTSKPLELRMLKDDDHAR